MDSSFINNTGLPFCKGCGHTLIASNTEKALQQLGYTTDNVILVTDIGCHGIIDKSFNTHTVHGLHGRSVALAAGVTAALNDKSKKVIVFIGDGGSTIGMQHLIDSAHNGFNMTVVIHNNMLYGMTGGQPSEFTPLGFKTPTNPGGVNKIGYNICDLASVAGASFVSRVMGIGDFSEALALAFSKTGFSVIEVIEICPSYGVKSNPGLKLSGIIEKAGMELKVFVDREMPVFCSAPNLEAKSLISEEYAISVDFSHHLLRPVRIMICGSAGEGVQSTAELLAISAIRAGLNVTKKGSYPVTVGIGFSSAEIIISPESIHYTGSPLPDVLIITSADGLVYAAKTIKKMKSGRIFIDEELSVPESSAEVITYGFRKKVGGRSASLFSLFYVLKRSEYFQMGALIASFNESKLSAKLQVETLLEA